MNKWHLLLATAVLILAACQKTSLKSRIESPVFMVGVKLENGDSLALTAGLNDIYHFTRVEDGDGFWRSINAFSTEDCPEANCSRNFQIEYTVLDTAAVVTTGSLPFTRPDTSQSPTRYLLDFTWNDTSDYRDQLLLINNSQFVNNGNSAQGSVYESVAGITFEATAFNQVESETYHLVNLQNPQRYPSVQLRIDPLGNGAHRIQAILSDSIGVTISWQNQSAAGPIFEVDNLESRYTVFVYEGITLVAVASLSNLPTSLSSPIQTAGYEFDITEIFDPLPVSVALQYIDFENRVWRSDWGPQTTTTGGVPFFQVNTNDPWEDNENGVPNRKLNVNFHCTLFNQFGEIMQATGQGVAAMAIQ